MNAVLQLIRFLWMHEGKALRRGLLLSFTVLVMGMALLGLSGWFIIAAAAAGLAGVGQVFDVFRPAAGVRFFAIGRTAARYGERILTHDATLRALARLRVQVLGHLSRADFRTMVRMRGADVLNRLTSDIDALDGLTIRLIMPVLAGSATLALAFGMLWWLVNFWVSLFIITSLLISAAGIFWLLARKTYGPNQQFDLETQLLRLGMVDHLRGRDVLAFAGVLEQNVARLHGHISARQKAHQDTKQHELRAGVALGIASGLVTAGTLLLAGCLALSNSITPAQAGLGFFATLALFETIAPLRRGLAEIAAIRAAANRLAQYIAPLSPSVPLLAEPAKMALQLDRLQVGFDGPSLADPLSLTVQGGDTVALVGASGSGKTTVLNTIAGLLEPQAGSFAIGDQHLPDEAELRQHVGYLQQRSALISGSIRDALCFGAEFDDADLEAVLRAVGLWDAISQKGGLDAILGESGQGLSGGQRKRVCLARVLLRRPAVLLLDEVTEGLDRATAEHVLTAIRQFLPDSAIVLAAHRREELEFADRHVQIRRM